MRDPGSGPAAPNGQLDSVAVRLSSLRLSSLICQRVITAPIPKAYEKILVDNSHKTVSTMPGPNVQEALPLVLSCHLGRTKKSFETLITPGFGMIELLHGWS